MTGRHATARDHPAAGADIIELERRVAVQCYASRYPSPLVIVDGRGCELIDSEGKVYLDLTAQMGSACLGHRHPAVVTALRERLDGVLVSPAYIHPDRARLAGRLLEITDNHFARVYFGVTGSDAIEAALKFARKRSGRWKVVSHWNGYHGSTLGALSAHGIAAARLPYEPLLPGFVHVSPPDSDHGEFHGDGAEMAAEVLGQMRRMIEREGPREVAAVIVEPIMVGGGMIVPPDSYLAGLRTLCDEFGILLIFDEVVTGIGRTGRMFGFEHSGAVPDMLVLGKGLTAGYQALSAVLVRSEADPFEHWSSGDPTHLHTLAGNALGCAAAMETLDVIERERLVDNAAARGSDLLAGLEITLAANPRVVAIRGRGLLVGIELDPRGDDPKSLERRAVLACRERGLLVQGSSGPYAVIVLHPPLILAQADVRRAVDGLALALQDVR